MDAPAEFPPTAALPTPSVALLPFFARTESAPVFMVLSLEIWASVFVWIQFPLAEKAATMDWI